VEPLDPTSRAYLVLLTLFFAYSAIGTDFPTISLVLGADGFPIGTLSFTAVTEGSFAAVMSSRHVFGVSLLFGSGVWICYV